MTIIMLQHLLDITHLGLAGLICRVVEYSLETPSAFHFCDGSNPVACNGATSIPLFFCSLTSAED